MKKNTHTAPEEKDESATKPVADGQVDDSSANNRGVKDLVQGAIDEVFASFQWSRANSSTSSRSCTSSPTFTSSDRSTLASTNVENLAPDNDIETCNTIPPRHTRAISNEIDNNERIQHFVLFAHGKVWTALAVIGTTVGFILSLLSRRHTEFVKLQRSYHVSVEYDDINAIGLSSIRLCQNSTLFPDPVCFSKGLGSSITDDTMVDVARFLASLATVCGFLLSTCILASIIWKTINLKPVGYGLLFTYFAQSFSMLFFDSNLCAEYKCKVGTGCTLGIVSSIFWIVACIGIAKMDAFKIREERKHQKLLRKRARDEKRRLKKILMNRKISNDTHKPESIPSTSVEENDINEKELFHI